MHQQTLPSVKARFSINVVENSNSELLLLKRSKASKFGPGLWGFPAGHIDPGESPEECALRELEEEIGPVFTVEDLSSMGPVRDSYYGGIYEINLFHRRWLDGDVKLNHEHTAYAWVKREEYKDYPVMDGIDEDIRYFNIWPSKFLNTDRLPDKICS
ncbi:MAG: NUDIX domain-containing protein [Gammaproteobacteria bacterium]|jgi:8-oxo-dGTP diphosphatase|nr:NUDIX domain-containing protein [Gammaproteobacteria bacterium]